MPHNLIMKKIAGFFFIFLFLINPLQANVIGADTQNFNPNPDGLDYVTVQSASTLTPGVLNFGFFLNFAANSLPLLGTVSNPQAKTKVNDTLLSGDFNFALGLTEKWQVGASIPYLFRQSIDNEDQFGRFADTGVTEFRLNSKYRILDHSLLRLAGVLTVNKSNIANNPFTGEDPGLTWTLEFVVDKKWGDDWSTAFNLGYRWRDPGREISSFGIEPISNQLIASAAVSRYLSSLNTLVIGEIYGSVPDSKADNEVDRNQSSLEALIGLKHNLRHNLSVHAGFGSEVGHGTATADWRVYTGLNYAIGPLWQKTKPSPQKLTFESDGSAENYEVKTYVLSDIRFHFDSSRMVSSSYKKYKATLLHLRESISDIAKLEVHGHTDSLGRSSYNQNLSLRRAKKIAQLLRKDIPEIKDIQAFGFGEDRPIASNVNFQGRLKNRRVEVKLFRKVKVFRAPKK